MLTLQARWYSIGPAIFISPHSVGQRLIKHVSGCHSVKVFTAFSDPAPISLVRYIFDGHHII